MDELEKRRKQWINLKMKQVYLICVSLCLCGFIPGLLNKSNLLEIILPPMFIMFVCSLFIPLCWCGLLLDSLKIN